jgi:hypothetical protein
MQYISKYSNGKKVSAAQYITEIICEHYAKKEKYDLHYRFWTTNKWSLYYRNQIATANQLVKKYEHTVIIRALNSDEAKNIYSLRAPHLKDIIEKYQSIVASENKVLKTPINRCDNYQSRKSYNKKNILDTLKETEDEF